MNLVLLAIRIPPRAIQLKRRREPSHGARFSPCILIGFDMLWPGEWENIKENGNGKRIDVQIFGEQKSVYRRHSLAVPMYTPPRYIFLSFSVLRVDLFDLDHVLIVYSEMASSRIEMDGWCRGVVWIERISRTFLPIYYLAFNISCSPSQLIMIYFE